MKRSYEDNFRVVVYPRRLGDFGVASVPDDWCGSRESRRDEYRQRCEAIVRDIKRHADSVGSVSVESDTEAVCEHCGAHWTEDSDIYNGGCCQKDQQTEDDRQAEALR